MGRFFNVNGDCKPGQHYMVDIQPKLDEIKRMVDQGDYFTINRARQYGKTTTLRALGRFLEKEYLVLSLDFQMFSFADFRDEASFISAFSCELFDRIPDIPREIQEKLAVFMEENEKKRTLSALFRVLSTWCGRAEKPLILLIDEVDSASNNQVFMDFLAQLRGYYINRDVKPTFQSVILAGVYDIKNIRQKIRTEEEHKNNSPWNTHEGNEPCESLLSFGDCPWDRMILVPYDIASDFFVDMSFSAGEIAGMLADYEHDRHTGMDIMEMSDFLYAYTSGYPFLVSCLCKLMDERVDGEANNPGSAWTRKGFLEAIRILLSESNTLFDSLIIKLADYPELEEMLRGLLFKGKEIAYVVGMHSVETALMFGFVKISDSRVLIANRIFETLLYNYFLAVPSMQQEEIYDAALKEKTLFTENGHLNMEMVLERFVEHFDDLYGDSGQKFYENDGRRYFMLFLKPIINGIGNCYVEAETRNRERTDLIVDYCGEQFIIETKIWHGSAKHKQGENQLFDYLQHHHLDKGYMLTFNFNKKKETGVKEIPYKGKVLIEAVV